MPIALAGGGYPEKIALPNGFAPEGIETRGNTFYTGSVANGAIWVGDLRKGTGRILVPGATTPNTRGATGIEYDRGRLWVAGAGFGTARVYDATTGALQQELQLATPPGTFINDVVVTKDAAYFTDSQRPRALPGRDLEQRRAGRGDHDSAGRRVRARRRAVQPERDRRDREREVADRSAELLEEALPDRRRDGRRRS